MLKIGQQVKYLGTDVEEVGVVVWAWLDEHGDEEAYVAFFGASFPANEPSNIPYILRYYATSLETII